MAAATAATSTGEVKQIKAGYLDKLPTWSVGSSIGQEDMFRRRYFVLTETRVYYFEDEEKASNGSVPKGQFDLFGATLERENKLEFIITNSKKRLLCRAASEQISLDWFNALCSLCTKTGL